MYVCLHSRAYRLTDGGPNDEWHGAAEEARRLGEQQKLVIFGVGIGRGCHFEMLAKFCPANRPPYRLSGYDFPQFFHQERARWRYWDDAASGFTISPKMTGRRGSPPSPLAGWQGLSGAEQGKTI